MSLNYPSLVQSPPSHAILSFTLTYIKIITLKSIVLNYISLFRDGVGSNGFGYSILICHWEWCKVWRQVVPMDCVWRILKKILWWPWRYLLIVHIYDGKILECYQKWSISCDGWRCDCCSKKRALASYNYFGWERASSLHYELHQCHERFHLQFLHLLGNKWRLLHSQVWSGGMYNIATYNVSEAFLFNKVFFPLCEVSGWRMSYATHTFPSLTIKIRMWLWMLKD